MDTELNVENENACTGGHQYRQLENLTTNNNHTPAMQFSLNTKHEEPEQSAKGSKGAVSGNFRVSDDGVYSEDAKPPQWLCSRLDIPALARDSQSDHWSSLLEFKDADGVLKRWRMPNEMLAGTGDELCRELLRQGLSIAPGLAARKKLMEYLATSQPSARVRLVDRTGWHEEVFVFPDGAIGSSAEPILYQGVNNTNAYQTAGTLEDWQREVAALCRGNSRLIFAVSAAFASMLLDLTSDENGGFHYRGASSTGKTTALVAACSVFGGKEYLQRWRATTNGLEGLAAAHNDTLLCLDELAQVNAYEAGEIAYLLANGTGKQRATTDGSARQKKDWRLLFLSSGEISLADHMQTAGKRAMAGQEIRLADIPADTSCYGAFEDLHGFASGAALSDAIMKAARGYYGTPAREFVRRITGQGRHDIAQGIDASRKAFMNERLPNDAKGQASRVTGRFALVAAGGELATALGITGWKEGEALQAAATCFSAWLEARGGAGDQEQTKILSQVRAFFEAHGDSRFVCASDKDRTIPNRAGSVEFDEEDKPTYYVLTEAFRKDVCAGLDSKQALKVLEAAGILKRGAEGKPSSKVRIPGIGSTRCYAIRPFGNSE